MKRTLDVLFVVATSPVWVPIVLCVACSILLAMGRPVLYVSPRAGLGGRVFRFLKFRTMDAPEHVTPLGRILRASSIDELPQLLHVLSGRMSLVGPRPLPAAYLPRYSVEQMRRHDVRPGITGWAQVNGRNNLDWDEKFRLDVWYVDHQSLGLDLKILAMTVCRVLRHTGINHAGYDTMYEFRGCKSEERSTK